MRRLTCVGSVVLTGDYMSCLNRLMRFPPVEHVLAIFERAMQIRDLPDVRAFLLTCFA